MDYGQQQALQYPIPDSVPLSWLGRTTVPPIPPSWITIDTLTPTQIRNLMAQIAYDASDWDYTTIGGDNELGRYQLGTQTLEDYGLLAAGSNTAYGTNCVNYQHCWRPTAIRKNTNSYASYISHITSLQQFLLNTLSQEQLAAQIIYDLYNDLLKNGGIVDTDTADVIAGMLYVAWTSGAGLTPDTINPIGTGAYAWRFSGADTDNYSKYNSGRYTVLYLSQ